MQARKLPAQQGWTWIIQSFYLWKKNPLLLTTSSATFLMIVMLPTLLNSIIGDIGQVLSVFAAPPLTVGMYLICRAVDLGQPIQPGLLFQGFRHNMRNLALLSAILLSMALLVSGVVHLIDDGSLAQLMKAAEQSAIEASNASASSSPVASSPMASPDIQLSGRAWLIIVIQALFYCFMTMVNYFAPQLVGLKQLSPVKALVFSLLAYWRNLGAFLVFLAGLLGVALGVAVVSSLFGALVPVLGPILIVSFVILLVPCSMAASYLAVRDIFGDLLQRDPQ